MSRNYGIMSDRQAPRGASTLPAATRDEIHSRDSNVIQFPSGSILADDPASVRSAFERNAVAQGALDILFLGSAALFVSAVASLFGIFGYVFKLHFFP